MKEMADAPEESEPVSVYLRFRRIFGDGSSRSADARKRAKKEPGSTIPFGAGRDPEGLGAIMDSLTSKLGWSSPLARSELLASWLEIAGAGKDSFLLSSGQLAKFLIKIWNIKLCRYLVHFGVIVPCIKLLHLLKGSLHSLCRNFRMMETVFILLNRCCYFI